MRIQNQVFPRAIVVMILLSLCLWTVPPSDMKAMEEVKSPGGPFLQETKDTDPDITKPVPISKTAPKYPEDAKKEGVIGDVRIETFIDKDGKVVDSKVVNEVDARLAKAALEALKEWKFKPALDKSGHAVKVKTTITIRFALH